MMTGFGRYNLLCKLGEGGMGELHLARQKTLKRFCAIKLILNQPAVNEEMSSRFLQEARAAALLSHPCLVHVIDCDKQNGQMFIAMEFVEGMTLTEVMQQHGRLPLPLVLYWIHQTAAGLEYIHGKKVVHRDIKSQNVMVDSEGAVKIVDLGLAKLHGEGDSGMTMTGACMGSPHYMSPEQIEDSKSVDHRTDLYSLGIVMYELLVGKPPFSGKTSASAVMMAHIKDPIPSVKESCPEFAGALDALIARLTAKRPADRMPSAGELVQELQPLLARHPLDQDSNRLWSRLDFLSRKVQSILIKNRVDIRRVDDDLDAPRPEPEAVRLAGPRRERVVPARVVAAAPAPRKRSRWRVSPTFVIFLLLLGGGWYFFHTHPNEARDVGNKFSLFIEDAKDLLPKQTLIPKEDLKPLFSQPKFDPLGKTISEIVAEWGEPASTAEMGDETVLTFGSGMVTMKDGKATDFKPKTWFPGNSGGSGSAASPPNSNLAQKEEQQMRLKRTESELRGLQGELSKVSQEYPPTNVTDDGRDMFFAEKSRKMKDLEEKIRQVEADIVAMKDRISKF